MGLNPSGVGLLPGSSQDQPSFLSPFLPTSPLKIHVQLDFSLATIMDSI